MNSLQDEVKTRDEDSEDALEEHLLEHGHCSHDARLPARAERVHLDVACNQRGRELGIRGCACAATPNGLRDVMNLSYA